MADNSEFPEDLFVVHTEYPRFILNVEEEEVEWLDDLTYRDWETDRKSTRLNSSHITRSRMPSSA